MARVRAADEANTDDAPEPGETGYCRNSDCSRVGVAVPLWRKASESPALCQCGQHLHDEPHDPPSDEAVEPDA